MAKYKDIVGTAIRNNAGNIPTAETGQIFFDSNTFTISANGSEKIHGSTSDLTVSTERAGNTLVYTDGTQGWLLKNN